MHILCFPENERITPILLWDGCYWFSMVGDGGGCEGRWEGVGRALGGRWEGVGGGGALGGHWEGVGLASGEGLPGSLIYRQIKSLHCSGYLLVTLYYKLCQWGVQHYKLCYWGGGG